MSFATQIGTAVHDYAAGHIANYIRLKRGGEDELLYHLIKSRIPRVAIDTGWLYPNLMAYVNDAIGYRMSPEIVLDFTENCFGTADAISFDEKKRLLRVHDLKTGKAPAHFEQLELYSALFCLKYQMKPEKIKTELRLYQGNEVQVLSPSPDDILKMMDAIRKADQWITELKQKG